MAHAQFVVSDNNPNDTHGGGGCICDPVKQIDCKPPYAIFHDNFLEDPRSPVIVICQACVETASERLKGELLSVGERGGASFESRMEVIEIAASDIIEDDVPDV